MVFVLLPVEGFFLRDGNENVSDSANRTRCGSLREAYRRTIRLQKNVENA
jgi:hypothetical protein